MSLQQTEESTRTDSGGPRFTWAESGDDVIKVGLNSPFRVGLAVFVGLCVRWWSEVSAAAAGGEWSSDFTCEPETLSWFVSSGAVKVRCNQTGESSTLWTAVIVFTFIFDTHNLRCTPAGEFKVHTWASV